MLPVFKHTRPKRELDETPIHTDCSRGCCMKRNTRVFLALLLVDPAVPFRRHARDEKHVGHLGWLEAIYKLGSARKNYQRAGVRVKVDLAVQSYNVQIGTTAFLSRNALHCDAFPVHWFREFISGSSNILDN